MNRKRPASSLEKSSTSLMIPSSASEHVSMVSAQSRAAGSRGWSRSRPAMPTMPLRGVRSSWDMFAMNSLFCLAASSATSRATSNSRDMPRRSRNSASPSR